MHKPTWMGPSTIYVVVVKLSLWITYKLPISEFEQDD